MDNFGELQNILLYFTISVPENEHDVRYQREYIKRLIDIEKLLKGINRSSFIAKPLLDSIANFMDFEPKLPFKKVSRNFLFILNCWMHIFIQQGIYRFKNLTLSDQFYPTLILGNKILTNFRFVGRYAGQKSTVFIMNFIANCETRSWFSICLYLIDI